MHLYLRKSHQTQRRRLRDSVDFFCQVLRNTKVNKMLWMKEEGGKISQNEGKHFLGCIGEGH